MTDKITLRIAMIQMHVVGNNAAKNLQTAERMVKEAALAGAELAVLPECMDLGWTHPASLINATEIPDGEVFRRLQHMARENNMYLCSGMTELEAGKVYNSAVLLDNRGELILKHRKINKLDIEKPFYCPGDRINMANTSLGKIGVMICADAIVPDLSIPSALARMQPDIILSPCAWAVPADHDNEKEPYGDLWRNVYRPISRDFSTYIIAVSNVGKMADGPWKGWNCIGASLAFDNAGQEMLQCAYGVKSESIAYVNCSY